MYKIFMDSFYEAVAEVSAAISTRPTIMYADDVLMQSKSPQYPPILHERAHGWAQENAMAWNPAKSFELHSKHTRSHSFFLGHDRLTKPPDFIYLRISEDENGINVKKIPRKDTASGPAPYMVAKAGYHQVWSHPAHMHWHI